MFLEHNSLYNYVYKKLNSTNIILCLIVECLWIQIKFKLNASEYPKCITIYTSLLESTSS